MNSIFVVSMSTSEELAVDMERKSRETR